ncbi:MAG: 50S ribosomal protein L31 [Dehalococcoidia bacterium]
MSVYPATARAGPVARFSPQEEGSSVVKAKIHPNYVEANVVCACGNTFQTARRSRPCTPRYAAAAHRLFTGEQRIVDTATRRTLQAPVRPVIDSANGPARRAVSAVRRRGRRRRCPLNGSKDSAPRSSAR